MIILSNNCVGRAMLSGNLIDKGCWCLKWDLNLSKTYHKKENDKNVTNNWKFSLISLYFHHFLAFESFTTLLTANVHVRNSFKFNL